MIAQLNMKADPLPLQPGADGAVFVADSAVLLEDVIQAFEARASPEQIVARFSTLQLADVYAVLAYYLRHSAEVQAYLQQRESAAARERMIVSQAVAEADRIGVSNGWPPGFFEQTYGALRDLPMVQEPQGEYETRDEIP